MMLNQKEKIWKFVKISMFPFVIFLYSVYTFALTDPNIVYSNNSIFMGFQRFMWDLGFQNRPTSSLIYFILISVIFITYLCIIDQIKAKKLSTKSATKILLVSAFILIFSNPALSHDIYNYIFNARMLVDYSSNPHILTALDFADDPWTRFLHNTHTPAPYGYGWTVLSVIPYIIGLKRLKTTMLAFKLLMGSFLFMLVYFQKKLGKLFKIKNIDTQILTFVLNPLVLIETFSNGHNDVVMMGFLLASMYYFHHFYTSRKYLKLLLPALLFAASISIKYATIASIGGFLWWLAGSTVGFGPSFGLTNSIAHFTPLLSKRSQRFHPWYLIWSFSFYPLIKEGWMKKLLLAFSFSSMLSYIPSLYYPIFDKGEFAETILSQRQQITFILPVILVLSKYIYSTVKKKIVE